MNEQYAVLITGFPLFHGFTLDGARMLLESGEVKEYSPGEMVIKEGDSLHSSYWCSPVNCKSLCNASNVTWC